MTRIYTTPTLITSGEAVKNTTGSGAPKNEGLTRSSSAGSVGFAL